jgi:hypothetical protein
MPLEMLTAAGASAAGVVVGDPRFRIRFRTWPAWPPLIVTPGMPVAISHVRAVIVVVAATNFPSGDTASAFTLSLHSKQARDAPVAASHTRTSPSLDPVTIRVPSGTKAASASVPRCSASTTLSLPVATSQVLAVPS